MDFKNNIATNSGVVTWNEEFRSLRAIHLVYLFSVTSFAAVGLWSLVRRILSSSLKDEPDFNCPEYYVRNGDIRPPLTEGFTKVRNRQMGWIP